MDRNDFESELRALVLAAVEDGLDVEGGYDVAIETRGYDLTVEVTRVVAPARRSRESSESSTVDRR